MATRPTATEPEPTKWRNPTPLVLNRSQVERGHERAHMKGGAALIRRCDGVTQYLLLTTRSIVDSLAAPSVVAISTERATERPNESALAHARTVC